MRIFHKSILPFGVTLSISFDLTTFHNYIKNDFLLHKTEGMGLDDLTMK